VKYEHPTVWGCRFIDVDVTEVLRCYNHEVLKAPIMSFINYVPYGDSLVGLYRYDSLGVKPTFKLVGNPLYEEPPKTHAIEFEKPNSIDLIGGLCGPPCWSCVSWRGGAREKREGDPEACSSAGLKITKNEIIGEADCSDPRVFLYKGRPFGIFTSRADMETCISWGDREGKNLASNKIYLCDIIHRQFTELRTEKITERHGEVGKNWTAMVDNDQLYIVYSPQPLIIYKYHDGGDLEFVRQVDYEGDPMVFGRSRYNYQSIRGGTSFIKKNKNWYGVAHKSIANKYHQAVLIKASEDFDKIEQITLVPRQKPFNNGVFDPLSIYEEDNCLVFVANWYWHHNCSLKFCNTTLECRLPFDELDLLMK